MTAHVHLTANIFGNVVTSLN